MATLTLAQAPAARRRRPSVIRLARAHVATDDPVGDFVLVRHTHADTPTCEPIAGLLALCECRTAWIADGRSWSRVRARNRAAMRRVRALLADLRAELHEGL